MSSFPSSSYLPSREFLFQEYNNGIREMRETLETMRDVFLSLEYNPLVGHEMCTHHDTRAALRGQLARACSFSHHMVPRMELRLSGWATSSFIPWTISLALEHNFNKPFPALEMITTNVHFYPSSCPLWTFRITQEHDGNTETPALSAF